ncbi:hypothetical protein ACTXT7_010107 [Hymenolepis weldensis]
MHFTHLGIDLALCIPIINLHSPPSCDELANLLVLFYTPVSIRLVPLYYLSRASVAVRQHTSVYSQLLAFYSWSSFDNLLTLPQIQITAKK